MIKALLILLLSATIYAQEIKPVEVPIVIKLAVHDAHTGDFIEQRELPLRIVNREKWEMAKGEFTEMDWNEYKRKGYISVFLVWYEGII